jgi:iron complex transport system substrate-binding protein
MSSEGNKRKAARASLTVVALLVLVTAVLSPAVAMAAGPYPLEPGDTQTQGALGYLQSIQAADGSIGGYGDLAWAVMAVAAAGEDPRGWNAGGPSVVDYLKDNAALLAGELNLASAYARSVLAIVAVCEDPSAFGAGDPTYAPGGDYLSELKGLHNGSQFVDQWGATDILNDDLWALIALIAAGEPQDSPLITSTVDFIKLNQGDDGGWSWATVDNAWYFGSDVDDTAVAIMALIAAGEPQDSPAIAAALDFIKYSQDESGGFTWSGPADPDFNPVNGGSTAWAIDAIVAAGQDPTGAEWTTAAGNDPVDFLLTLQQAGGEFVYADPLPPGYLPMLEKTTSDAIVALLGHPYWTGWAGSCRVGGVVEIQVDSFRSAVDSAADSPGGTSSLPYVLAAGAAAVAAVAIAAGGWRAWLDRRR